MARALPRAIMEQAARNAGCCARRSGDRSEKTGNRKQFLASRFWPEPFERLAVAVSRFCKPLVEQFANRVADHRVDLLNTGRRLRRNTQTEIARSSHLST
jgi:hypothetical protein